MRFFLLLVILINSSLVAIDTGSIKVKVRFENISEQRQKEIFRQLKVRAFSSQSETYEIESKGQDTSQPPSASREPRLYEIYSLRAPSRSLFLNALRRWKSPEKSDEDEKPKDKAKKDEKLEDEAEKTETFLDDYKLFYDGTSRTFILRSNSGKVVSTTLPPDQNLTEVFAQNESNTTEEEQVLLKEVHEEEKPTVDGRVGPDFEIFETAVVKKSAIQRELVHTWSVDKHMMEREEFAVDISHEDSVVWRERLQNISILERREANAHRDYGSSYIMPVLNSVNYDNTTLPLAFSDIPVSVSVAFNVLYLANFDSQLMEFSIDLEMEFSWFDMRLANNYTKPIRIREKPIIDQIWRPDPYIVNSKYSYLHYVSFPNVRMRITPQGLVTYTMRVSSVCNCFMRFCLYPHDRQTCDMKISSIAYSREFLQFYWHSTPVRFQSKITLPELHVTRITTEGCSVEGKLINSSCLRMVFALERDSARFVVEKYIPSTLAMMFAWVAPYVPYNYEDVRIITPITVLLTLVQMEKGDKEIRTSYLTSIDVWFAAMKSFTVLSLLESLCVMALIKRSRAMDKNAQKAANEFEKAMCQAEGRRLNRLYHRVDSVCRFASPIVFVVFFVYYVLFVAQGADDCLQL
ncbi:unnamed protein product [Caenorhabditis auriculariae]|uniref:Uncharacterized protein n=1 Tax=Caenorhabditis auriculariae TaxID=2777116 RepID=A0A8S1H6K7_9PELO|nr:unnamed protein product [Caenorhabditis auriculariae]